MIQTRSVLKKPAADKAEMLLYALALEIVTGCGATFARADPATARSPNAVSAVVSTLTGPPAYDFLEKLAFAVLPRQIGFDGVPLANMDAGGHLHLNITSMLNFPDFEEVFDMFEVLKNANITLVMDKTKDDPAAVALLLSGLCLPVKRKAVKEPPPLPPKAVLATPLPK